MTPIHDPICDEIPTLQRDDHGTAGQFINGFNGDRLLDLPRLDGVIVCLELSDRCEGQAQRVVVRVFHQERAQVTVFHDLHGQLIHDRHVVQLTYHLD